MLILEDEEGKEAITPPAAIIDALGEKKPSLVFLSACRTAEAANRNNHTNGAAESLAPTSDSFSQSLISAGVANVLGWDGSVYDQDALFFAERFYDGLARYERPAYSAAGPAVFPCCPI